MTASNGHRSIVMVAGEASGDMHGARLVHALQALCGPCTISGMGGQAMRSAGADILVDANLVSVVGITEAITKLPALLSALSQLKRLLSDTKPDLLILIDFPDFNLKLAAYAKKRKIPVLYYISPQIWAWRANRVKKIKTCVDHMAVILPFETDFYTSHGVPVTFVGHPLMDDVANPPSAGQIRCPDDTPPTIGLLPGSRDREVRGLLPVMLHGSRLIQKEIGSTRFLISCAPSIDRHLVKTILDQEGKGLAAEITEEPVGELLPRCRLAIVASGTVTLQGAIHTTPMIITYVVSPVSYWLGRRLIRVAHIGLANLIAERCIVPELIQQQVTPQGIREEALAILTDPARHAEICTALSLVRDRLGTPGASRKVARIARDLMESANVV